MASYRGEIDFDKKKESKFKALLLGPDVPKPMQVLVKPYGVAVSKAGVLYVTDTVQRKVFVIDPTARTVSFLGESGQGRVVKPIGVAVEDDGKVFVADASQNRIFGYDPDGNRPAIAIGHEGGLIVRWGSPSIRRDRRTWPIRKSTSSCATRRWMGRSYARWVRPERTPGSWRSRPT